MPVQYIELVERHRVNDVLDLGDSEEIAGRVQQELTVRKPGPVRDGGQCKEAALVARFDKLRESFQSTEHASKGCSTQGQAAV